MCHCSVFALKDETILVGITNGFLQMSTHPSTNQAHSYLSDQLPHAANIAKLG